MKSLVFIIALFSSVISTAQTTTLNPTSPLPPCTPIMLGETVDFERGALCDADVVLLDENDFEIFRTSDAAFSYTFDTPGQYTFYCGAGAGAVAMAAICVQIGIVPTLSQWAVICLALILLIFAIVTLRRPQIALS